MRYFFLQTAAVFLTRKHTFRQQQQQNTKHLSSLRHCLLFQYVAPFIIITPEILEMNLTATYAMSSYECCLFSACLCVVCVCARAAGNFLRKKKITSTFSVCPARMIYLLVALRSLTVKYILLSQQTLTHRPANAQCSYSQAAAT